MSMAVAPFVPFDLPLVVGTRQNRCARAVARPTEHRRHRAARRPSSQRPTRSLWTWTTSERDTVSRPASTSSSSADSAEELKGEGLLTAIREVPGLHPDAVLTVVGDGPGRARAEELARQANAAAGRRAVVLTGELGDPRPAYAMADVCLGMFRPTGPRLRLATGGPGRERVLANAGSRHRG